MVLLLSDECIERDPTMAAWAKFMEKFSESMRKFVDQFVESMRQVQPKSNPKHDRRLLICGATQEDDCFCVAVDFMVSVYYDENDDEVDVVLDYEEEESHQTDLQIQLGDDSIIPENGANEGFQPKIECPNPSIHQVCGQLNHDKVNRLSESEFSSPSLADTITVRVFSVIENGFPIAIKVFDENSKPSGYIISLDPDPPDDYDLNNTGMPIDESHFRVHDYSPPIRFTSDQIFNMLIHDSKEHQSGKLNIVNHKILVYVDKMFVKKHDHNFLSTTLMLLATLGPRAKQTSMGIKGSNRYVASMSNSFSMKFNMNGLNSFDQIWQLGELFKEITRGYNTYMNGNEDEIKVLRSTSKKPVNLHLPERKNGVQTYFFEVDKQVFDEKMHRMIKPINDMRAKIYGRVKLDMKMFNVVPNYVLMKEMLEFHYMSKEITMVSSSCLLSLLKSNVTTNPSLTWENGFILVSFQLVCKVYHGKCKKGDGYIKVTCFSLEIRGHLYKVTNLHNTNAQDVTFLDVQSSKILPFDKFKSQFINVTSLCAGTTMYSPLKYYGMTESRKQLKMAMAVLYLIIVTKFFRNVLNLKVVAFEYLNDFVKGQEVAVKVIPKAKMTRAIAIEGVRRELKILRINNLIQFYNAYEDHDNVYIVMELYEGGELLDRILARGRKHTEDDAKAVMIQILNVVLFCHLQGVVHQDLKPKKFLFTLKDEDSQLRARYVDPEVLHRSCSTEAVVWSIGVTSYILLGGSHPFWARTKSGVFRAIIKNDLNFEDLHWPSPTFETKDFVNHLLKNDPRKKLTAAQVLSHSWIRNKMLETITSGGYNKVQSGRQYGLFWERFDTVTLEQEKNICLVMLYLNKAVWTKQSFGAMEDHGWGQYFAIIVDDMLIELFIIVARLSPAGLKHITLRTR